jgi:hypothetical protein
VGFNGADLKDLLTRREGDSLVDEGYDSDRDKKDADHCDGFHG